MLIAAARGMLDWLAGQGSRPAIRTAIPLYLRERETTIHGLAAVTGGDALRAGASDPDGFTVRFLEAVRREAADGRDRLLTMERNGAKRGSGSTTGGRSNSRLPAAVDLLAASPLLSVSALAEALGCSVEGASRMLDTLVGFEIAAEVTGRTGGRAPALRPQAPAADPRRDDRRPAPGAGRTAWSAEAGPDRALRRAGHPAGRGRGGAGPGAGRARAPGAGELRF